MAISKSKKTLNSDEEELIKSEVASYASSLGLASSLPSSGFNDSDFRKVGRMKPRKHEKSPDFDSSDEQNPTPQPKSADAGGKLRGQLKPKKSPLDNLDPFGRLGKTSSSQKCPLMKASSLSAQWYIDAEELEARVLGEEGRKVPTKGVEELKSLVAKKRDLAERLMQQFVEDYHSSKRKGGDMRLVEKALRAGTTADRVSALTCLVEDNPIANLKSIDSLLHMVTTKVGKRYAFTSFEALKELFLFRLLPERKLKCLLQRPLDSLPESKDGFCLLLFWYWEESLKQRYEQFVIALEEASKDMLPNLKDKAVKLMYSLLRGKAEQERRLLSALVNKLGDPVRKSASGAGYHLSCLLSAHPNMKAVVIDEVDSFIFRPHVGLRAKYHAVNFLCQILLSKTGDGPMLAKRLVDVYFALFKVLISEANDGQKVYKNNKHEKKFDKGRRKRMNGLKGNTHSFRKMRESPSDSSTEMDSRLLSALLTGVNRAFPFVASDEVDDLIEVQTPILFRLVHSNNFNVGVQALMLLYQISSKSQIASDRYYRALYAKLLSPAAVNSSKPEMFLGLLVKSMKNDINIKRIAAFAKRILQVSLQKPPQYACGCLFMVSEVLKARPPLWNMMLQNESTDDDLEHFEDILEESGDVQGTSQGSDLQDAAVSVGKANGIVSVDGLSTSQAGEDLLVLTSREGENSGEDGGVKATRSETLHSHDKEQDQAAGKRLPLPAGYDPRHREPSYCNADRSSWWELTILASHAHPSVASMAQTLLSGANIVYNGDPLNDLSLAAFLDKFMEKKPKANQRADGAWHGGSQIAPARKLDMNNPLIGDQILQLAEEDVPPEDVVFHRFYMNKSNVGKKLKKKKKKVSEDDDDVEELLADGGGDESDDEEIDNMLGLEHLPSEEAEGDYDYDDLDNVANEDDDLLGNDSDEDLDSAADLGLDMEDGDCNSDDDDAREIKSEADDSDDMIDKPVQAGRNKKRKSDGSSNPSPFASLEDYEHLLNDGENERKKPKLLTKKSSDEENVRQKPKWNKKSSA